MVWYEGAGTTTRNWLHADERGSVVAVTNSTGAASAINSYDEYGIPASSNIGRFQYTGQSWLPELGLYYYKARIYSPTLGRFLQTDPIGCGDGINWYDYVGGDPVNGTDPDGQNRRRIAPPNVSVSNAQARAARNQLTAIVPDYRDRPSASSATPSALAASNRAEGYRAELSHIRVVGSGAFQGRNIVGEGNYFTPAGRIQNIFSGVTYNGPIFQGYNFTGSGGMAAANRAFDSIGLTNVKSIQNGAGRHGSMILANGTQIDVTAREGGGGSYSRLEVLVRTDQLGSNTSDRTTFKIRYDN